MGAYENMDAKVAGLKQGLDSRVKTRKCGESDGIGFGMPIFVNEGDDENGYLYHRDRADSEFDADLVTGNSIATTVNGEAVTAVPFNTSHLQTMNDWIAQIEADIDNCSAMLDPGDSNNRTIWVDIDGVDMALTVVVTGGASQPTATITYVTRQIFEGMSMNTQKESAPRKDLEGTVIDAGVDGYSEGDSMNVMLDGWITGVTSEAVDSSRQAYVVPTGANQGKLAMTVSGNEILNGLVFDETVGSAGLANVRVNK